MVKRGQSACLSIGEQSFQMDGRPVRLLSGAIHYFRVVPEYWRDRLIKLKAMGLNTVETYVPWNLHEGRSGRFSFEGPLDIVRYLELAAELDLMVIVRPGPYICAEWDLGGLPSWLLRDPGMRLRCCYPPYLKAVDRYFDELIPRLVPLQASRGGPIVAMQVENEYGSYGNDQAYLRHLADGLRNRGIDGLLFTADGASDSALRGGTLPDIFKTVNFGSRTTESFAKLREYQPSGPLMCMEFWNGWFDHWGEEHHRREAVDAARELDAILASGASVNLYMFHGGTNFGFMAGANQAGRLYQPDVTSYDYDAPLDESGFPTTKFFAFREVIGNYVSLPELVLPEPLPRRAYGTVELNQSASLFDNLDRLTRPHRRKTPVPMESLGADGGFILYRTTVDGPREPNLLIADLRLPIKRGLKVTGWGLDKRVVAWLGKQGVSVRDFADEPARTPEVILVGKPGKSTRDEWLDLARHVARGSVAVFLEPDAFKNGDDATYWVPLVRKGKRVTIGDWLYHKECVAKRHPVFEGLQTGLLDWNHYDQAIGHDMFSGQDELEETICAAFYPCALGIEGNYAAGAMVASYQLGAGRFILNTLNLCEQIDRNPAADRLLLNLVRYAQARRSLRIARVPEKLGQRLMGEIYPANAS